MVNMLLMASHIWSYITAEFDTADCSWWQIACWFPILDIPVDILPLTDTFWRWNLISAWKDSDVSQHIIVLLYQPNLILLWPCNAIWWHTSGSTLDQVMACCLMAPSHYLNQCWHISKGVLWYSPENNFSENTPDINSANRFEIKILKLFPHFPWANELI